MLINGDLVRIPQGTVLINAKGDLNPIRVSIDPSVGIVIDSKTPCEDLVKILMGEEVVMVDKRVVQLVGG